MYLVGLTGGIGSGKTTVGLLFRDAGIPVIDADEVARYVVRLGSDGWAAVYKRFGSEYFDPQTGELDRKALADLVFKDEVARRDLNRITHSRIQKEIGKRLLLLALKWHQFAVIESPLLFESEAAKFVQRIVCVSCDPEERVRRVAARDGLAEDEVWARIEAQMDDAERNRRSHFVIDSHCHVEKLKQRANVVLRDLRSLRLHWPFRCFTAFIALFTLCLVTWPFRALSIL